MEGGDNAGAMNRDVGDVELEYVARVGDDVRLSIITLRGDIGEDDIEDDVFNPSLLLLAKGIFLDGAGIDFGVVG